MRAEMLRRAASLMRERAEAATPGSWSVEVRRDGSPRGVIAGYDDVIAPGHVECMSYCYGGTSTLEGERLAEDAEHIASWHPAVALAVAKVLESDADCMDMVTVDGFTDEASGFESSIELARAYLREPS